MQTAAGAGRLAPKVWSQASRGARPHGAIAKAMDRMSADTDEGVRDGPITNDFWEVLLWSFWIFIWIAAVMVWFRCVFDMFSDQTLSGWTKAGWALLLIFVPWLGALIYMIARGGAWPSDRWPRQPQQRSSQEEYIQQVAGKSATPAAQIADAKALLDSGAIQQTEFDVLKAKALA